MRTRYNRTTPIEPFGRTRVIESGSLAVQFHITGINSWAIDPKGIQQLRFAKKNNIYLPWVVEIVFAAFDEKNLELVIQVGQAASHTSPATPTTTNDDINLLRDCHFVVLILDVNHVSMST